MIGLECFHFIIEHQYMRMNQFSFCLLSHQARGRQSNVIFCPTNKAGNAYGGASDVVIIIYDFPLAVFSLLSQDIHRFVASP